MYTHIDYTLVYVVFYPLSLHIFEIRGDLKQDVAHIGLKWMLTFAKII